ncbi:hypothetical protein [Adhaeribacter pallidiroseus]|uniref:STAS/SEC14 domain-containing protein n=1 Tax=Adhaeribacter pallidiroseus TaxID=2072847 RepID=A0A369QCH7_9BACT|nr:hypothetical protein [Adhaeribacter pallidiroseus]RDC62404.1 hypothetical protein AHMF7616_00998 [Adhaeribacter pallidiroseus]
MNLQTIFCHEKVVIQVSLKYSYLELEWLTHPISQVFREVVLRAHHYAHEQQLTKWLCNIQQADYLEAADQLWLVKNIFTSFNPQLTHDYAYLIRPMVPEVVTAYNIMDLVEQDADLSARVKVAVFTDIDLAHQWLFTPVAQKV